MKGRPLLCRSLCCIIVFTTLREAKIKAWDKPLTVSSNSGNWELTGTTAITKEPILGRLELIPADQIEIGGTSPCQTAS